MEQTNEGYSQMLEKYREIDEDEILSGLSAQELQQLEGEIDREVLNQIPEEESEEETYDFTSTEDEIESIPEEKEIRKPLRERRLSRDSIKKRASKSPHKFKVPTLKKASSRDSLRRQSSEEGGELKKELLQAVRHRTNRSNSSGVNRRYGTHRRHSSSLFKRRNSKIAKEDRKNPDVNANCITAEMLTLRPNLKKVKTREPKQLAEVLHGVCLKNVTSGAKVKDDVDDNYVINDEPTYAESDYSDVISADEEVASANDSLHRTLTSSKDDDDVIAATSSTTAGSTSTDSYDVIGELSINANSVEETILRIWEDDEDLVEVNLNNIQNVEMDVFEQLASAMEENTHVKSLQLSNTGLTDKMARALASMLKRNKCLEKLNVESNFITGGGALRMVAALRRNSSLTELRIDNQRHIFGANVEHEFAKILKDNKSLLRFGYQFANPGPRMSASNYLTKNMDDVRKKRVAEQRKRAKAGHSDRPPLRRQTSSEWYRKEKADKAKKMKDQGIHIGNDGTVKEEDVQKVLSSMKPHEMAMLEKWFTGKLMGKVEPPKKKVKTKSRKDTESPVALRGQLLDSIRNQSGKTKLKKVSPSPRPSTRSSMVDSDVEAPRNDVTKHQSSPLCDVTPRPRTPLPPTPSDEPVVHDDIANDSFSDENPTEEAGSYYSIGDVTKPMVTSAKDDVTDSASEEAAAYTHSPVPPEVPVMDTLNLPRNDDADEVMSSNTSSIDVIEWKDGESYDSDEYEVVEIEVSDSEEEDDDDEEEEEQISEKVKKPDPVKALDNLGIFSAYETMIAAPKNNSGADKPGKLNIREAQKSPTVTLSPGTPRPVREDESWIGGPSYSKAGSK
ncbi:uncharacterized protein LOC100179338 isoform X2 [Ciona intestinalis]